MADEEVYDSFGDMPLDNPPQEPDGDDTLVDPKPPPLMKRFAAKLLGQPATTVGGSE